MNDITKMTDDELMAEAQRLLAAVHDYEFLCLHGSSRREPEEGRAAGDRLIEVCAEIGVRQLADRFRETIARHMAAYEANLKELKEGDEIREDEKASGRLSWWDF